MIFERMNSKSPKSTRFARARLASSLAIAAALGFAASSAQAQTLRFSDTLPGGIVSTGNTLGLSKGVDENGPGSEDSIGTFISLDPASVDDDPLNTLNPWAAGTTWNWERNGSAAVLTLPEGAQVLYAELVWAGSYDYWPEDVSARIDDPVSLISGDAEVEVSPDPATALTLAEQSYTGFWANYYLRSADVTSFVAQQGSATYAVAGVAATQGDLTNSLSAAGWSLVVAYRHDGQPIRNVSVFVGGSFVDEDSEQDYTVSGFCAPPHGVVEGNVVISALEGDANLTGDDLSIGVSESGDFVSLVGPNNPADNFFCSQINGPDGHIDSSGSFGAANHDAEYGRNRVGARQGWDLTTLALTSDRGHLENDQTSAVLRTTTTGDSYVPVLVALELDVKSPDFSDSLTEASEDLVEVGDQFVVTTTLKNSGEAQASDLALVLPVDAGLTLVSFSMDGQPGDASGATVTAADLAAGVDAGTLRVGETRSIELVVHVVGPPDNGTEFVFTPDWGHSFTMCSGQAPLDETFAGPQATVPFYSEPGVPEGGQGGGDAGQGGAAPALEDTEEMGGCQCATVGTSAPAGGAAGALALVALGAALGLRRRRR
ncbi:MAG: hypothetical protein JRI23_10465 [Deltaproteobacteria bacterium]|jgi:MYXO-CTERM domain-containing protein/uncharacterized repeat protein (TIGR01451 family)|nr:hypothetical protein [Deltaproteobacteria bacterium]MBW2532094.1 hypothetical protein [Deltaproteobacteria bacterium]